MFEFTTQGTCSKKIFVELDGKKIKSVDFEGGCNGNLKAVMNETMSSKFLIIANNIFNEFVKTL